MNEITDFDRNNEDVHFQTYKTIKVTKLSLMINVKLFAIRMAKIVASKLFNNYKTNTVSRKKKCQGYVYKN